MDALEQARAEIDEVDAQLAAPVSYTHLDDVQGRAGLQHQKNAQTQIQHTQDVYKRQLLRIPDHCSVHRCAGRSAAPEVLRFRRLLPDQHPAVRCV